MRFHTRQEWGARAPRSTASIDPTNGVTVHWEGTAMGPYAPADVPRLLRSIQAYHMDVQGWSDIAYNLVVDVFGDVWEGRGVSVRNAASGTTYANTTTEAVCALVGEHDPEGDALRAGVDDAIDYCRVAGGAGPGLHVHSDWFPTTCPGDELRFWMKQGAPRPGSPAPTPQPNGDDKMQWIIKGDSSDQWWLTDGITARYVETPDEAQRIAGRTVMAGGLVKYNGGGSVPVGPIIWPQADVDAIPKVGQHP